MKVNLKKIIREEIQKILEDGKYRSPDDTAALAERYLELSESIDELLIRLDPLKKELSKFTKLQSGIESKLIDAMKYKKIDKLEFKKKVLQIMEVEPSRIEPGYKKLWEDLIEQVNEKMRQIQIDLRDSIIEAKRAIKKYQLKVTDVTTESKLNESIFTDIFDKIKNLVKSFFNYGDVVANANAKLQNYLKTHKSIYVN